MSRNGSGTYNLPAGNPVVTGTTITTTWANTTLTDIANTLTGSVASDGQTPMSGNLNIANNRVINVADPTSAQDAATKAYVDAVGFTVAPGTSGNVLTSNGTIWTSAAATTIPSGSMQMWPTATAPTGYLLCAGAAVSRTTYAALYAVIGTTYGVGDGSTTFNLPDLRGRSPFGVSASYALATTGGSADAIVVSHTHAATVTDPGHLHAINGSNVTGGFAAGSNGYQNTGTTNSATATTGISVSNATTGSSGTGANLQPYLAINFIIKV